MGTKQQQALIVIDELFSRLVAISPAFKQAWPTAHEFNLAKKEWLLSFIEADINDTSMIAEGLRKLRMSENPFIPSPGQFIAMCNITFDGAPDVEKAFDEATKNAYPVKMVGEEEIKWSHKCVRYAAHKTGMYELRNSARNTIFPIFKKNYTESIQLAREGKILDMIEGETLIEKHERLKKEAVVLDKHKHIRTAEEAIETIYRELGVKRKCTSK